LSDEPNNIRLLSDRSLYILQNLSSEDVTFLSRYGDILTDGFYLPVTAGAPEEGDVESAVDLIRRDLNSMAVEQLLECICAATNALVELGVLAGQKVEDAPSNGEVSVGPDEQFPDQASYFVAKCNASNAIYDTVLATVQWLETNNIDLLGGLLGGMTTALGMGLLISGPVGWAVTLAAVTVTGITTYLISQTIDFSDLEDALIDVHDELVLSLFNASNTITAKDSFIAEIAASTEPTTAIERDLVRLMLSSDLLNLLFDPRQDVGSYQSPSPVDCGTALLASWTYPTDAEGWTFRDDSTSPSSASGVYNAVDLALEVTKVNAGGGGRPESKGTWLKTGLSIAVPAGSSVQMDHSGTSDAIKQGGYMKVIYSDVSETIRSLDIGATAGTMVMTLPDAKTINDIECSLWRKTSAANTHTSDILEVRVYGT
jgi:hypothetical protein